MTHMRRNTKKRLPRDISISVCLPGGGLRLRLSFRFVRSLVRRPRRRSIRFARHLPNVVQIPLSEGAARSGLVDGNSNWPRNDMPKWVKIVFDLRAHFKEARLASATMSQLAESQ